MRGRRPIVKNFEKNLSLVANRTDENYSSGGEKKTTRSIINTHVTQAGNVPVDASDKV